ncbi:hypothetical protein F383_15742 [Gossypium arboreum]|uniref:Uncharacterized protein n=1 Tax=Gossypium arboreum TaxID=29729 RepID=A0A0B0Q1N1_GOSAR|nr:hypothetical protein F383_15742 [Gossypium arboreum]
MIRDSKLRTTNFTRN